MKSFDLNGPEALTGKEIALLVSKQINKDIRYESCSVKEYVELLTKQSVPNWMAQAVSHHIASFQRNSSLADLNDEAFYEELTGDTMTTLKEWTKRNCERLCEVAGHECHQQDDKQSSGKGRQDKQGSSSHFGPATGQDTSRRSGMSGQRQSQGKDLHSPLDRILKEVLAERFVYVRVE